MIEQPSRYITTEQAATMVTDKQSLYLAFQRNGYYMPKASEAFVTIKFLTGIREGRYFMPKTEHIKKRQCADPPSKKVVAQECSRVLNLCPERVDDGSIDFQEAVAMRRTAKHLAKRPADVPWMLDLIATIQEGHEYFKKDYSKPKKVVHEDEIV